MEMTGQPSAGRSVDASGAIPSRISASIDRKIDNGEFYDAHQLVRTMFFRFVTRQEFSQAVAICRVYALKFAGDASFYARGSRTAFRWCSPPKLVWLFRLSSFSPRAQLQKGTAEINTNSSIVAEHHAACKAAAGSMPNQKHFRQKWPSSRDSFSFPDGHGHLLFCRDPEALAQMLRDWETLGYLSERPFFSLRLVFILLCMKDVETAEKVLVQGGTGQDWDSAEVPAPLQLAYLLVCACKFKSEKLFNLLKQKYHLVLRRDETFSKYMDEIEKRVLGRIRKPNPGFASLLSSFMGTGVDD
ncbi:golgi to er traffic protein 4 [Cystoisospora suis]|uniref:Golgi to er traffic protein 4 n=1 Tax=Cystoisospora suis TaxID=483139 RepID=A0A2C6LEY4_9APIC|nr:golgi to er traffic protein 4 [Cystoisospora suis]